MPEWLRWVLVTIGASMLGMLGKYLWDKGFAQPKQKLQEHEELEEHRKIQSELDPLMKNINQSMQNISTKIDTIDAGIQTSNKASIVLLRDRMKCSLQYCTQQGYASNTDWANWIEMYNIYKELGGNHFREYVNCWKDEMEELHSKNKE